MARNNKTIILSTWKPTKNASWIIPLVTIPFIVVGIGIIYYTSGILENIPGTIFSSLRTEMLYLGIFFIISPFIGFAWMHIFIGKGKKNARYLLNNGIPGTAKILNYNETGVYVNNTPKIEFDLEISSQKHDTYQTSYKDFISIIYFGKLAVGNELAVLIDPHNKANILIDFEQLKYT